MAFEKEIRVISVVPTTDISTRENIYQVTMGEFVEATPDVKALTQAGQLPPSFVPAIWLVVNLKVGVVPFKVGSKWKLQINEEGDFSVTRVGQ